MGKTEKDKTLPKTVPASETVLSESSVVASSALKHERTRKQLIVAFLLLALVVALGAYAYIGYYHPTHMRHIPPKTAYDKAEESALSGKTADAQSILDAQLKSAKTVEQQGRLYEQKASIALSANDKAAALKYAQQAEALHPSRESAYLIAECAQLTGDNAMAIKYFQIVISRSDPNTDKVNITELQANIQALQGSST